MSEGGAAPVALAPGAAAPLPHNFEAEMALLGAILSNNRAYDRVADFLRPEHFADLRHGRVFEACGRLIASGVIADPVTLKNAIEADGSLADIGGAAYLARLAASVITITNTEDYGRTIHDRWLRRALVQAAGELDGLARAVTLDRSATQVLELAEMRLAALGAEDTMAEGRLVPLGQAVEEALEHVEAVYKAEGRVIGVTTGIGTLDRLLGGLMPGDLVILAGRPSMGKTALATHIALSAARAEKRAAAPRADGAPARLRVAFFSLEMQRRGIALNMIGREAGISAHVLRRGPNREQLEGAIATRRALAGLDLAIDQTAPSYVSTMRMRARRFKPDLIIVDYLQLIDGDQPGQRHDGPVARVTAISKALKTMAKALDVPVLALAQLSRQVEQREDKRPQLSDLRESGAIEQDADVVIMLYREDYYLERQEPDPRKEDKHLDWETALAAARGKSEAIVLKQRTGPIGSITLYYDAATGRFADYHQHREEQRHGPAPATRYDGPGPEDDVL